MSSNPLLAPSSLPAGVPDFPRILPTHYEPAVQAAIAEARKNIDAIKACKDAPTFDNTIVALETASDLLNQATSIFYNQLSAAGNDDLEQLAEILGPITSNFSSDIALDPVLFARIKSVYDQKDALSLTPEQTTLLDQTYKGFVRNGALLGDNAKEQLRALDEKLSVLTPQFEKHLKKSTESFTLTLTDAADLSGLPEGAIVAAREAAAEMGAENAWVFTLHAPSFVPFITYAENRNLREQMWRAYNSRAYGDAFDNQDTLKQLVSLKDERAKLLGFAHHADYVLAERMAGSSARVFDFLTDLLKTYHRAAKNDLADLRAHAAIRGIEDLKPWDVPYVREKLQQKKFAFDSEDLRPYFPIEKVLAGTFTHFERLFGVRFVANKTYPVWHADVQAFDVRRMENDDFVGVLYADFYPRTGKRSGAWMTTYRDQGLKFGAVKRPLVAIVCNFTKPTADTPSLLTHDEVATLFHEMGHAMHMMLSDVTYASLSGTNVKWDFVELPSQLQENWSYEPETLSLISGHYQTGAAIPADLVQKLNDARTYMAGMNGLRQMTFSYLDMKWHATDPATITDVATFEDQVVAPYALFPRLAGPTSTSFSHIFGGGYSAGYYSYKWAEVLDADAFEAFQETGLYNTDTAARYAREILAKGGSEDPNVLYERFRGRPANTSALLKREGVG